MWKSIERKEMKKKTKRWDWKKIAWGNKTRDNKMWINKWENEIPRKKENKLIDRMNEWMKQKDGKKRNKNKQINGQA